MTPPIRFLLASLGGWTCLRAAMLVPWPNDAVAAAGAGDRVPTQAVASVASVPTRSAPSATGRAAAVGAGRKAAAAPALAAGHALRLSPNLAFAPRLASSPLAQPATAALGATPLLSAAAPKAEGLGASAVALLREPGAAPIPQVAVAAIALPEKQAAPRPSRWSLAAWLHARPGGTRALAAGGQLGGSQAGARLNYRVAAPLTLVARLTTPRRSAAAEAAVGVEWQPLRAVPLRLVAERRERLGRDGRSAFALTVHGGVSALPLPAGFRLDAYGQAGLVGARSRDRFADGAVRVAAPLGSAATLGVGFWAAAQPGVSRIDAGPSAGLRLPGLGATLSADWRFRIGGNARPGSGPALTLWTDF